MDKAQLLTGAQIQEVGQHAGSLGSGAVLKVLPHGRKEEVLIISGITPVRLVVGGARRCSWSRWRRRRASQLRLEFMLEVGGRCRHARCWRTSDMTLLMLGCSLVEALITAWSTGSIEHQFLGQKTPPPLGKAHGPVVRGHGPALVAVV